MSTDCGVWKLLVQWPHVLLQLVLSRLTWGTAVLFYQPVKKTAQFFTR